MKFINYILMNVNIMIIRYTSRLDIYRDIGARVYQVVLFDVSSFAFIKIFLMRNFAAVAQLAFVGLDFFYYFMIY